jgi:hypothetical protein
MTFKKILLLPAISLFCLSPIFAQQTPPVNSVSANELARLTAPVENISREITNVSQSLENLNKNLFNFFTNFSSNQGLKLSEKQQKMLYAFEILNRAEQRLANLQKLKLDLTEKQTAIRLQNARIADDLLPESIDRYISTRGTTNAEQLREIRRQALTREKYELSAALADIQNSLQETNTEIRQTENFLRNIRRRVFPEIEKELTDF